MAEVDYGYGDEQMDYGYGDASPAMDYGYGDTNEADNGYGKPDDANNGYGEAKLIEESAIPRPKRRCSVTKFSLATETPLTAASVIADLRNGVAPDITLEVNDHCQSYMSDDDCAPLSNAAETVEESTESGDGGRAIPARKKSGMLRFLKRG